MVNSKILFEKRQPGRGVKLGVGLAIGFTLILLFISTLMASTSNSTAAVESAVTAEPVDSRKSLTGAGALNKASSTDLKWDFGGRQQQGWALYIPLVCDTVGAATDIESDDFSQALARWQTSHNLRPTGVVDNETWSKMINKFQSRRIKERSYPSDEELVLVSESEFYDPTRAPELRRVEKTAYAAYRRMIAAAVKDRSLGLKLAQSGELHSAEKYLKIISAFRSREYQNQLRQASPTSGRAGLAVNSPHFTGRALDIYVGGQPVSTADSNRLIQTDTAVYKWLVKNAAKFGFRPYFYEPWHWEYAP